MTIEDKQELIEILELVDFNDEYFIWSFLYSFIVERYPDVSLEEIPYVDIIEKFQEVFVNIQKAVNETDTELVKQIENLISKAERMKTSVIWSSNWDLNWNWN